MLLASIVQTSKAQETPYKLLLKGEASPYDSAVAIEINRYRQETVKLRTAETVIESLQEEVELQKLTSIKYKELAEQRSLSIDLLQREVERKDKLNQKLVDDSIAGLEKALNRKWFEKPEIWVGVAVAVIVLIK